MAIKMKVYECPDCKYIYNEKIGAEHEGYPENTKWQDLPEDFPCPNCFVREKADFVEINQ